MSYLKVFLVWALLLCVLGVPVIGNAQSKVQRWIKLEGNHFDLYPRNESVFLTSMDRITNGIGMLLMVKSTDPTVSHFEYSINGSPYRVSADGRVPFAFTNLGLPKIYFATNSIRSVTAGGVASRPYSIAVNYYPPELYAASGRSNAGYLIIQQTDLSLTRTKIADWITEAPSAVEIEFARSTWGHLISPSQPDYENARSIIKNILSTLDPRMGIPSDAMNSLSGMEQYQRAISGADKVWCSNIQTIFIYACNALGIRARKVGMIRYGPPTPVGMSGPTLMFADGHQTTEVFSDSLNAWVFMDTTFNIIGTTLGTGGLLTIAEFHRHFNDPNRINDLNLLVYDPVRRTTATVPVLSSSLLKVLGAYYKRDQEFYYLGWVTP